MTRGQQPPYWLDEGTEPCTGCTHPAVHETVCHCAACDGPVCCMCADADPATGEPLCPACAADADSPAGGG